MRCRKKRILIGMLFTCIMLISTIRLDVIAMEKDKQNTNKIQAYTVDGKWVEYSITPSMPDIPEKEKEKIVEIIYPECDEEIFMGRFEECQNLQKVTLSSAIKTIPWQAFWKCENLKEIIIPEGVEEISYTAFCGCKRMESITLPKGLKKVGSAAFKDCEQLKTVKMLDSSTQVDADSFENTPFMTALWEQTEGEYVIWNHILMGVKKPQVELILPEGVTNIADFAFAYDNKLCRVVIPSSVKLIGDGAFSNTNLENVVMNGGQEIGDRAFSETRIQEITVPSEVKKIGEYAFSDCTKLVKVKLSSGLEEIEQGAFCGCSKLTKVTLPSGLKKIGESAFYGTGIKSIIFPETTSEIGIGVVDNCPNLTNITILNKDVELIESKKGEFQYDDTIVGFAYWDSCGTGKIKVDKTTTKTLTVKGYKYSTAQELVKRIERIPRYLGYKKIKFEAINPKKVNKTLESIKVPKTLTITKKKGGRIKITLPKNVERVSKFTKKTGQVKITHTIIDGSSVQVTKKGWVSYNTIGYLKGFCSNRIYTTVTFPDGSRKVFTTKINVKPKKE